MTREHFTRGGQRESGGEPLEKRRADLGFELEQLPVDRRRRHMQLPRGFTNRIAAANRIEIAQGACVNVPRERVGGSGFRHMGWRA